jgi:hypothetical protein
LSAVVDPEQTGAILRRALTYPYATPERSYLYRDGAALELPAEGPDLGGRTPLLAYGANAAPEALAYKLASLSGEEMPALAAELEGFDVVYSAHVSPYGAVPATLHQSPGTTAPVFVVFPDSAQLELLTAYELNYDLVRLSGICCRLDRGEVVGELAAYRSKHGPLALEGDAVALAAVRSRGRTLPELDEPALLDRVRAQLEPELSLEGFVRACVERGGIKPLPRFAPL